MIRGDDLRRRQLKFRGICRGLIEADGRARGQAWAQSKFRGICRGLIEAQVRTLAPSRAHIKIPRHLPRPH